MLSTSYTEFLYTHACVIYYYQHEEPLALIDVYSSNLQFTFIKLLFHEDELQKLYIHSTGRANSQQKYVGARTLA